MKITLQNENSDLLDLSCELIKWFEELPLKLVEAPTTLSISIDENVRGAYPIHHNTDIDPTCIEIAYDASKRGYIFFIGFWLDGIVLKCPKFGKLYNTEENFISSIKALAIQDFQLSTPLQPKKTPSRYIVMIVKTTYINFHEFHEIKPEIYQTTDNLKVAQNVQHRLLNDSMRAFIIDTETLLIC